jgi:hypothetical protein
MEVALAIVEAPRNKMRCYQAPHRGLTIISAAALIVSIFSLAATLWVLFLTLDAGLVVY